MGVLRSRSEQGPTPGSLWVCSLSFFSFFSFFLFSFSFFFFFFFSQFLGLVPSSSSSLFGVARFCHLVSRAQSRMGRSSTKTPRAGLRGVGGEGTP